VGRDAKVAAAVVSKPSIGDPVTTAFWTWLDTAKLSNLDTESDDNLEQAFRAGIAWALKQAEQMIDPKPLPALADATGSYYMVLRQTNVQGEQMVDQRTQQTILAALAFYRDSTLAYGAIPGQLSAQEVSELINKLSPTEEPSV
jgi:hypothetical protein